MSDEHPPRDPPREEPTSASSRPVDPYAVISYLIGGVAFYGAIGWLIDRWLDTRGFVGGGIVLGAAAGVWLVWLRYGRP